MFHYFGYGSNMSATSLAAKGVESDRAEPAILRDWRLAFTVPNFFAIEGCTGNIVPDEGRAVHGVLYACDDRYLPVLDELEAVDVAYARRELEVETYDGERRVAYVYVGLPARVVPEGHPSLRYRNILVQGARDAGLRDDYVAWLRDLPVVQRPEPPPFEHPVEGELLTPEQLASRSSHVALAGAVFDMSKAPPEHAYLERLFAGRDATLFFLKRMDTSDGSETLAEISEGKLTDEQRGYLDGYLHEFERVYRYVGRLQYGPRKTGRAERIASAARAAHTFDPSKAHERHGEILVPSRRVLTDAEQTNRRLGHENLGFLSEVHGFAPIEPPRLGLPSSHAAWDAAMADLTGLYRTLGLRRRIDRMEVLPADPDHLDDAHLLRAGAVLGMLAHAYWYVETQPPERLPPSLSEPWAEVRRRLHRPQEVLSYIDLIVYNWRLRDPNADDPRRVENMRLAFPTVDNQEERVFYLTQFEILSRCSPVIGAVVRAQESVARDDPDGLETELHLIMEALERVVRDSLLKINPNPHGPHHVDPVVWAKTVAPFAVPFVEGVQGPSGTSSPIFNLLDTFFGRRGHATFLGKEIKALRSGYPKYWQEIIAATGEVSITDYVSRVDKPWLSGLLKDAIQVYAGQQGFLGRHRMKVYGYLELAFKVGRSVTIGGFSGVFSDRTWDQVDSELEYARKERMASFPHGAHPARVLEARKTTERGTERVQHVVLDVKGAGVRYEPGDRCYVLPESDPELIERTLKALSSSGDETIALTDEWRDAVSFRPGRERPESLTLRELLRYGRLRPVEPRMAEALHAVTQSELLFDAIREQTTERWELWDLLDMLRAEGWDPRRLVEAPLTSTEHIARVVPPEMFRAYSIASVMDEPDATAASEVHLTVGKIRYDDEGKRRLGTASSFLARVAGREEPVSIAVHHPPRFALPADPSTPVILLAGGTGISPFRSFILERARQPNAGPTWLLLGVRTREHLHYRTELQQLVREGKLRLEVAFSRDDAEVRKVQALQGVQRITVRPGEKRRVDELVLDDRIGGDLLRLLRGTTTSPPAQVYVCGHARFARSAHASLKRLLMQAERGDDATRRAAAERTLQKLAAEGHYLFEVFTDNRSWARDRTPLDVSQVVEHNDTEHGYWMVIDGSVYDVTELLELHPGGRSVLRGYTGMDATQGYMRVHEGRTEVDAMRGMFEIGKLRALDFEGVRGTVEYDGVAQTVALAALHRAWVKLTYLVVEMQNALVADHSLQLGRTTRDEPLEPRSPYRWQRAIETHQRFLHAYLDPLSGPALSDVQLMTCGLLGDPRQASALQLRLDAVRDSENARLGDAAPHELHERLEALIEDSVPPGEAAWEGLEQAVLALEELDRGLLRDLKSTLTEALRAFERHTARTLDDAGETLISVLDSVIVLIEEYHRTVRWRLTKSGLLPATIPPPRPSSSQVMLKSVVSTSLWHMVEDLDRKVVLLRRSAAPVETIHDLVEQNEMVIQSMRPEHTEWGIVVDMRQAPSRNDPEFEGAMRKLRGSVNHFKRVALLVNSATGMLQVNRLSRDEGARTTWATQSEDAALRFAAGMA